MGFNFQAGSPIQLFEDDHAAKVVAVLKQRFGEAVPLGGSAEVFCLRDELGWSWWGELQEYGRQKLGEAGAAHLQAVDAWQGAYVDAGGDFVRDVLWPEGPSTAPLRMHVVASSPGWSGWLQRLTRWVRGRSGEPERVQQAAAQAMQAMVECHGARKDEQHGLQIGNLRGLLAELEALLRGLGTPATAEAVEKLLRSYSDDDARIDADPEIQCLCHAWLTGRHALEHRAPLWLVK